MTESLLAAVLLCSTLIIRLAFATPLNMSFHEPVRKLNAPAVLAPQIWVWMSSHWPLSYQSLPRVGTTEASVARSSIEANSPLLSVARIWAYTPATPARTSCGVWNALDVVSALCGTSVSFVHV